MSRPPAVASRPPAVAGRFYPADPAALAEMVDELVGAVEVPGGEELAPAYVVPHAGLRYSGPTAAQVYARLAGRAGEIDRVVLLGPAHYVRLDGCAAPAAARWRTPLGELPVDVDVIRGLAEAGHVRVDDQPHAPEHSIEVQLPFLQRVLRPGTAVVPVAIGLSPVDDVVAVITAARAAGRTVVLISTDLSHYLDDATAREQDARTADAVLTLAPERIGVRDACGVYGLRGVVGWARTGGLTPSLLHLCTSADTAGDRSRVVGYAAFAFTDGAQR